MTLDNTETLIVFLSVLTRKIDGKIISTETKHDWNSIQSLLKYECHLNIQSHLWSRIAFPLKISQYNDVLIHKTTQSINTGTEKAEIFLFPTKKKEEEEENKEKKIANI